ncbi:redoxin domain-containing protein [Candidatus Kaiserbacteria bacterium]|nr:redoxin domain-containing protein [Candidatus Kaiserbacteria bacterium]
MNKSARNAVLIIVAALIVASIIFLESQKVRMFGPSAGALDAIDLSATSTVRTPDFETLKAKYPVAKELVSPHAYINTDGEPIMVASMIGKKVVMIDFWTYSCINCERTIPYLSAWYEKYKDAGFEIIGVHSPEFQFEKRLENVQDAVKRFGIKYPVVLDSDMQTWNAYNNQYWPEHYLIDINGLVVDRHIGEGGYAETERKIQELLAQRKQALGLAVAIPTGTVDITQVIRSNSPETYFGAWRNEYLANGRQFTQGVQTFTRPDDRAVERNQLYFGGMWDLKDQYAQNVSTDARIIYKYSAKSVYFVASSAEGVSITVLRDGVPVYAQRGEDVDASGRVMIKEARLYKLISEPDLGTHTLEIIIKGAGLDAYTFTFG